MSILDSIFLIIFSLIILTLLIVFIVKKSARLIVGIIACLLIFSVAIYCGIETYRYCTASGGIWGELVQINTNEVNIKDMNFNFSNIVLTKTNNENEYSAKFESNEIITLDENEKYGMFINGSPCTYQANSTDYIITNYTYVFYGDNFNEILKDTLVFRFSFFNNSSVLTVTTYGGSNAVNLWNYYFAKNNFNVTISAVENIYQPEDENVDYFNVFLIIGDKVYKEYLLPKGSNLNMPSTIPNEDLILFGWVDSNGNVVTEINNINTNQILYAKTVGINEEFTVNFYSEDKLVHTGKYKYGESIDDYKLDEYNDGSHRYRFCGWSSETCKGNMDVYAIWSVSPYHPPKS